MQAEKARSASPEGFCRDTLCSPDAACSWSYAIALMSKRTNGRWVVYERREGEFIRLSRLFTTRAQAEKERDRLKALLMYKRIPLGVGFVQIS